ncbi:MAG: CDP-glycerol glycerophosphotransferase family protein [Ignavibacteriales bacterium]|nr:CDP-glycerol glycerophosphotransferase family protein [Ignavibacteriales bacterium]
MHKKKILFICGSLNQTSMMHQISLHLEDYDCFFTPYYGDGWINYVVGKGYGKFSILNGPFRWRTEDYLEQNNLALDYRGVSNDYDLVYTCADLIMPKNIRKKKVILVQEGMTDPENFMFYLVKYLKLYRWLASTSTMGMSNQYTLFCVASPGYKNFFIRKGAKEEKIIVTGIPNFDNLQQFTNNDFPHKNFVLVATSDARETYKIENRKKFIQECVRIAGGKQLIFKLHPNEKVDRATQEINKFAPGALVFLNGNINHMIANCDVLITKYSSVVYVGILFGKEVHSAFNIEELKRLMPIQNNGTSAEKIAWIGEHLLEFPQSSLNEIHEQFELSAGIKWKS